MVNCGVSAMRGSLVSNLDIFALAGWFGDRQPVFAETFQVRGHGFRYQSFDFRFRFGDGYATRKVRNGRAETRWTFFDDNGVTHQSVSGNCACFQILLSVPAGTSTPGFPATVTRPRFV